MCVEPTLYYHCSNMTTLGGIGDLPFHAILQWTSSTLLAMLTHTLALTVKVTLRTDPCAHLTLSVALELLRYSAYT